MALPVMNSTPIDDQEMPGLLQSDGDSQDDDSDSDSDSEDDSGDSSDQDSEDGDGERDKGTGTNVEGGNDEGTGPPPSGYDASEGGDDSQQFGFGSFGARFNESYDPGVGVGDANVAVHAYGTSNVDFAGGGHDWSQDLSHINSIDTKPRSRRLGRLDNHYYLDKDGFFVPIAATALGETDPQSQSTIVAQQQHQAMPGSYQSPNSYATSLMYQQNVQQQQPQIVGRNYQPAQAPTYPMFYDQQPQPDPSFYFDQQQPAPNGLNYTQLQQNSNELGSWASEFSQVVDGQLSHQYQHSVQPGDSYRTYNSFNLTAKYN